MEESKPSYYSIIPAYIRYDSRLNAQEKLMYGEITALSNAHGYCFASNSYFAKLYNFGINTDSNGETISKRLPIDEIYVLVEVETLDNYVLNDEPVSIDVVENMVTQLPLTNEKIKGYIQVQKTSVEDNIYSKLEAGEGLSGAEFEVYDENNNYI